MFLKANRWCSIVFFVCFSLNSMNPIRLPTNTLTKFILNGEEIGTFTMLEYKELVFQPNKKVNKALYYKADIDNGGYIEATKSCDDGSIRVTYWGPHIPNERLPFLGTRQGSLLEDNWFDTFQQIKNAHDKK
jgi:hypothetical protein